MRIVVVEDEATIRRGIIQLIQQIDGRYQVVGEADNGVDGVRIILEQKPDVIVTDIKMPDMSGLEMLEKVKRQLTGQRAVILSGYSEFDYAKRAITAGVEEYLLKPLTEDELRRVLAGIAFSIDLQNKREPGQQGEAVSLDYGINSLLLGVPVHQEGLVAMMQRENGLDIRQPFYIVALYLYWGGREAEEAEGNWLQNLHEAWLDKRFYSCKMQAEPFHLLILPDKHCVDELPMLLNKTENFTPRPPSMAVGFIPCPDLFSLRQQWSEIKKELQWSIVLGDRTMIDHSLIQRTVTPFMQYPIEIERRMLVQIHAMDLGNIQLCCHDFLDYWQGKLFHPEDVIHAFVQFAMAMIHAAKKVCLQWEQALNLRKVYLKLMGSLTWREISDTLLDLAAEMHASVPDDNPGYSPVIRRALNHIALHLHERITLTEVADKLRITPEYLSLLFVKEVGSNFNAYVRQNKMNRAKELLVQGDLSGQAIAVALGFIDPKYFYKVFKETTGLSTSDYVRIHRG